jgi:hypothetical protein
MKKAFVVLLLIFSDNNSDAEHVMASNCGADVLTYFNTPQDFFTLLVSPELMFTFHF